MAKMVSDLMSVQTVKLAGSETVSAAARQMSTANVGAVIVEDNGKPSGILTDRDIAVRVVAEGKNPEGTRLSEVCSRDLATVSPEDDVERAVEIMRDKAVRRVLVVDAKQRAVGVLSLGDLALDRDAGPVLGEISAASPNR